MRCPRCQQNNDGSAEKCIFCGTKLTESVLVTGLPMDKRPVGATTTESIAPLVADLLKNTPPAIPVPRPTRANSKSGLEVDDLLQDSRLASWESLERQERKGVEGKADDMRYVRKTGLPEWVYEVNYQNLPKKKGYIIFADENGTAFVNRCANPIKQIIALAIDVGIIAGLSFLAFFIGTSYFINERSTIKADTNFLIACAAIMTFLYMILFKSRSIGNRLMQIRMVLDDKKGGKPPFQAITKPFYFAAIIGSLLLTNYLPAIYVLIIPIALIAGYCLVLLPPDFRSFPDRLNQTYYIETDTMWVHGRDF
jgi:RDD family